MSKQEKASTWSALAQLLESRPVAAGQALITQGVASDTLYLVEEGTLESRLATSRGPLVLGQKGPGSWVGEGGMLSPAPASASVVALTAGRVRTLTNKHYLDLLDTQPRAVGEALTRFAEDLSRRVRRTGEAKAAPGTDLTMSQIRALQGLDRADVATTTSPRKAADKQMPRVDAAALVRTLEHVGVFAGNDHRADGLKKALVALAQTGLSVQTYLHGEAIVQAGERADGAFILLSGAAQVTAGAAGGPLATDSVLPPGRLFGHQAFFDDHVRSAGVTSVGASVVAVLWPGAVEEILRQAYAGTPLWLPILDWMTRRLAEDARTLNRRLAAALGA